MSARAKAEEPEKSSETAQSQREQVEDILRRVDALPILDRRRDDEILGNGD
jgi:hypothetical protein